MEYIYRTTRTQQAGIVLIAVLLLLLVLTLLGMSIFESSALQHKMSANYLNKAQTFAQAESTLVKCRPELLRDNPEIFSTSQCQIQSYRKDFCSHKVCYLLTTTANFGKAKAIVHELYEVQSRSQTDGTSSRTIDLLYWQEE